ncbi:MAG: 2,3-bisphosphoglycerate-independent phosphoglycerate mutase [Pseudomonadota bacterium]
MNSTPLLLLILDGWGLREAAPDNAISCASTPHWDRIWADCPHSLLTTSGLAVGLPEGQMGNSEVGHLNIGAGRIVYQELTRIGQSIAEGDFQRNAALCETIVSTASDRTVHLIGLVSDGGVHSHIDHLIEAIRLAARRHSGRVAVHALLDGRDTPPRSAEGYLQQLQQVVNELNTVQIASVGGRYFGMDRDQRWDRVQRAWAAIVEARAKFNAESAQHALALARQRDENDEFVQPTTINHGTPIKHGDSVLFINFRADRARQLSRALVEPGFNAFDVVQPQLAGFATMTHYLDGLSARVAYPPVVMQNVLGQVLADAGHRQLRIAETEKYAHVTYFFNGGVETVFPGEDRILIPSPAVATYDLQPTMSSVELTERLIQAIQSEDYAVIICNVANPDMVGHSGILSAAIEAVEAVDRLLGRVLETVERVGGACLVTADHGNVEQMQDPVTGQPHTAHTTFPVPMVFVGGTAELKANGSLRDLAPTMLNLLGMDIPDDMTGTPLVRRTAET